ncbi:CorA family divalent cation transporter [Nocardia asteroides]
MSTDHFDTEVLQQHWIPLAADDADTAAVLRERLGIDFTAARDQVCESDSFRYFPVAATYLRGETVERETIVFALGGEFLVTLQPSEHFLPFDKAVAKMRREPALAGSARGVMYALLWALNEESERVILHAVGALETMDDEIETAAGGEDRRRRAIGAADLRDPASRLNAAEQSVSRTQQAQLQLARAARHLMADTMPGQELNGSMRILAADIEGVRQHASLAYEKIRYLQQAVTIRLDARRNRILEMLTSVTAVLLPPTLIGTCSAMYFTRVPELSWQYELLATATTTAVAAAIPLTYLERKGRQR